MTQTARRWSRAMLGCLIGIAVVLAWLAGAAPAADLAMETLTRAEIDSDVHFWNGIRPESNGDYQYIVYWDAPDREALVHVKLTRRNVRTNATESIIFDGTEGTSDQYLYRIEDRGDPPSEAKYDGHNQVIMGLSPNDGRIHMSWVAHSNPHHYGISSERCLSARRLSECTFDWSRFQTREVTDTNLRGRTVPIEEEATYPQYFNDNRGRLYFFVRFGGSFRGNEYLNVYNDNGTWRSKGLVLNGRERSPIRAGELRYTDAAGTEQISNERGVYVLGMAFDRHELLGMYFLWKEHAGTRVEIRSGLHGLFYAWSADYGETWRTASGRRIATNTSEPIRVRDEADMLVVSMPYGTYPGGGFMEIDSNELPHLVTSVASTPRIGEIPVDPRLNHVWMTSDGTWRSAWMETENHFEEEAWGGLFLDPADNLYYVYHRNYLDWHPYAGNDRGLPGEHFTWQERRYVNLEAGAASTAMDTNFPLGIPISTAAGRGNYHTITLSINNTTDARNLEVVWVTDESPEGEAGRIQSFRIEPNQAPGVYRTYIFNITDADWTGTLRQLELEFEEARRGRVSVDWIHLQDDQRTPNVAKAWEFEQGLSMRAITSNSADNWATYTARDIRTESTPALGDYILVPDKSLYKRTGKLSFLTTSQGAPEVEPLSVQEVKLSEDTIAKEWAFPVDIQYWARSTGVTGLRWSSDGGLGTLSGTVNASPSAIDSIDALEVPVEDNTIRMRMKHATEGRQVTVSFITKADRTWNATKSKTLTLRGAGYETYDFDMREVPGWRGSTLYQLSIEPVVGARRGTFNIDSITIRRRAP